MAVMKLNVIDLEKSEYTGGKSSLCPGCGHDQISNVIIQAAWENGIAPEGIAKMSGIGCSSKTPAYFLGNSHGFNTVHGRMPSVTTGANMVNKDLSFLAVSGDGDTASIGIGQFIHAIRRNLDMVYIIENNGVYGLTKGQYSATVEKGSKKIRWESADYGHAYSTPTACELGGKDVLAVMGGKSLVVLDRRSGKQLAQTKWETKYDVNAASPVQVDEERIWISSGYGHGGAMVRFDGRSCEELWSTKGMRNQMATSVLIGDHLYGLDEAVLKCFDLEGNEVWVQRGIGKGALSAAGDRLLVHTGKGELAVVKATPEAYEELSREKVTSGGVCWTMPVLVDGRIYMRSSKGQVVARDHRLKD